MDKYLKYKIINILLNEIKSKEKNKTEKRGCKKKHTDKKILNIIVERLITGLAWGQIEKLKICKKIGKSTVYDRFIKYVEMDIFKICHSKILDTLGIVVDNNSIAYIDTTSIINKGGCCNNVGFSPGIPKHKSCKLSIISTQNCIPLGITLSSGNIHDINLIFETLPKKRFFKLLYGDKAYISEPIKKKLKQEYNIDLITESRSNQINQIKLLKKDKINMKNRCRIEHLNSSIKQYKLINTRYDKKNSSFLSNVYIILMKITLSRSEFNQTIV